MLDATARVRPASWSPQSAWNYIKKWYNPDLGGKGDGTAPASLFRGCGGGTALWTRGPALGHAALCARAPHTPAGGGSRDPAPGPDHPQYCPDGGWSDAPGRGVRLAGPRG